MKKLLLLTFVFMFAFNTVSFAAVSGSKARTSTPAAKPPTTQSAPAPKSNTSEYKPSAPAQSYNEKAPAAAAKPNTQAAQQPNTGGFLRSAGLFGGGMLLGSMLGGMFGLGNSGMFANIMGMIFNIMLLAGIFMAGRFLWEKFKNRDTKQR